MKIAGYETHPAADLFPMMEGAEIQALATDIKAHGLQNAITLYTLDGKRQILDGRNRARACEMAGVSPSFETWTGEGSPVEWVVSQNIHRRHLTTSQRATIAADLVPMFEAEARERMVAGTPAANLQQGEAGRSAAKAAQAMNVSERLVASAVKVAREAPIEVVAAVRRGELSVHAAEKQIPTKSPTPLPKGKTSRPPKASPLYSMVLVMPTEIAAEITKALRGLGFEPARCAGPHDAEMKIANHVRKEKTA